MTTLSCRLRALLACLAVAALPVAAATDSLVLEDHTWTELRDAIRAGKTTLLVPIGGTEQNGPHIVLGKHNARAAELAGAIAKQLGNALVAPEIAYVPEGSIDPPSGHMKYAGTISIPEDAFEKVLEGAARSFRRAGFRDIVFLGDHGGYRRSLDRVAARLDKEWAAEATRVHALPEYYRELPHAGREDTSLSMAMRRYALVRKDRVTRAATKEGAAEDPSGATEEAGIVLYQDIVRRSVEAIRKAAAHR